MISMGDSLYPHMTWSPSEEWQSNSQGKWKAQWRGTLVGWIQNCGLLKQKTKSIWATRRSFRSNWVHNQEH